MKPISLRTQLTFVAAGYAGVLLYAAALVLQRWMLYVHNPQDVAASSGMYAFGDLMLEVFIGCMLLFVTSLLALVIRKSENLFTQYSKILLGLSLSAPLSLAALAIPAVNQGLLGWVFLERLVCSPLVFIGFGLSRLLARFDRAKRLISYALVIELLMLVLMAALLLLPWRYGG